MSLLPEIIFRSLLVRGIRAVRNDSRLLDQLFRNLDTESAKEMREFFRTKAIYIDINYPRDTLKVPAIVMLLRQEQESNAFLGDSMGYGDMPDGMDYDDEGSLGGAASVSTLSGEGRIVYGPVRVVVGTNNTVKIGESAWSIDQFKVNGVHTIHILEGKGAGQQRAIAANGRDTVMVTQNWSTNPDSTSVLIIRAPAGEVVGEPRSIYRTGEAETVERLGSLYGMTYQMQVVGPNPEFTIYLAAVVKSILTLGRQFLEGQGIINMKLGATDFVPRAEYQPDFSYMRAINVEFQYPFDVFDAGEALTGLKLVIEGLFADGSFTVLSETDLII